MNKSLKILLAINSVFVLAGNLLGPLYAVWKTISNLLASVATLIGGLVVTWYGFSPMFYFMGSVALGCAIFTYLLPRKSL